MDQSFSMGMWTSSTVITNGKESKMTLSDLKIGQTGTVTSVGGQGALRQHILDMGVIPGVNVTLVKFAPMGDPMELLIHGYELTIRRADAAQIGVQLVEQVSAEEETNKRPIQDTYHRNNRPHPGLGEMHPLLQREGEHSKVLHKRLSFALVGNQNCGKTTLFNQLTGMRQHVGNFPGVTVDQKTGVVKGHSEATVTDLPGIYSLSPYTSEEIVSRDFLLKTRPTGIINIVDASNIERNLYLTLQLIELGFPMVVALNMMDEVRNNGGTVLVNELEQVLGVPVVPISALKNEGVDELVDHAIHVAKYGETPLVQDFCSPQDHGGAVHRAIHAMMSLVEDHAERANIPLRFAACKLLENDALVVKGLQLDDNEKATIAHIRRQMEQERGLDVNAAIADMRFSFILKSCAQTVVKPQVSKEQQRSRSIDRVLTGKWTALPAFLGMMALIFYLTFDLIGGTLQDEMEQLVGWVTEESAMALQRLQVAPVVQSLLIDGVYTGVGTIISFLPIIVLLFFFLSLLEDSGYMARVAFFMDRSMRKLGLSGRSIVPLLMGFGCSVPSVMASRTLPSERDRRMTVMLTPFMSCTAKLPIYGFFVAAFFPSKGGLVMTSLYLFSIFVGIVVALLTKRLIFKGQPVPFVLELPAYRMPGVKSVARLIWDKTKDFLVRAFSVIFIATIVVWFLQSFDFRLNMVSDQEHSMLAHVSSWIAPLFSPLGFASWKVVASLICGFLAKEGVVSTMTVLFGNSAGVHAVLSTATAISLLVFSLLYSPCVATIATVRREMGGAYAVGLVLWQTGLAWVVALMAYWAALFLLG